mmetsp:Transcript_104613/g.294796  ORF Transcript_104613/g.294796 Transcript_104613/m.294796 type:complete len:311 (+) Transcript_104613:413-1345(+)
MQPVVSCQDHETSLIAGPSPGRLHEPAHARQHGAGRPPNVAHVPQVVQCGPTLPWRGELGHLRRCWAGRRRLRVLGEHVVQHGQDASLNGRPLPTGDLLEAVVGEALDGGFHLVDLAAEAGQDLAGHLFAPRLQPPRLLDGAAQLSRERSLSLVQDGHSPTVPVLQQPRVILRLGRGAACASPATALNRCAVEHPHRLGRTAMCLVDLRQAAVKALEEFTTNLLELRDIGGDSAQQRALQEFGGEGLSLLRDHALYRHHRVEQRVPDPRRGRCLCVFSRPKLGRRRNERLGVGMVRRAPLPEEPLELKVM